MNKIAITGTAAFLALALFGFVPAHASEVTGTLSAGASAPAAAPGSSGGSSTGGSISGGVVGGSVSGGSGGGGGSNGSGSVLGASTVNSGSVLAAATFPGFPNTGEGGAAKLSQLTAILFNSLIVVLTLGVLLYERKRIPTVSGV